MVHVFITTCDARTVGKVDNFYGGCGIVVTMLARHVSMLKVPPSRPKTSAGIV